MLKMFDLSFWSEVKRLQHYNKQSSCHTWSFSSLWNSQRRGRVSAPKQAKFSCPEQMSSFPKNATHSQLFGPKAHSKCEALPSPQPRQHTAASLIQYQYSICRWPLLPPEWMWINGSRLVLTEWTPPRQRPAYTIISGSTSHWSWILHSVPWVKRSETD